MTLGEWPKVPKAKSIAAPGKPRTAISWQEQRERDTAEWRRAEPGAVHDHVTALAGAGRWVEVR